ncbi:Trifunctional nucleotide phosphoesterase protein YfkN [Roseobacter fucihabitans]|uniref:Trifunctional nucleotide phosphoesterase protein YfkN n=1 Tax=Roseobacter fucihabitans TaxID=1537242 RepID=A0ABZ2BZT8_9RHOB|nr:5'-nucleotidase C-terminal domain-containing protein [Roseobacter litoralis]MBC6966373.1 Trifunctional nucleotide phosphoesterase protein YfkN precursor [Roseobacter litoralis]
MTKIAFASDPNTTDATLTLRLLATSDLHMQLIAYDYANDRTTSGDSLARLASVIRQARSEAQVANAICLLVDNGDTLQGTPLGGYLVDHPVAAHPMIAAMNALGYDALGIGNHDFDHGLDHLSHCLAQSKAPVLCANLRSGKLPMVQGFTVLERSCTTSLGVAHTLRIGIVSVLPQQTAAWNRHQLEGQAEVDPPLPALSAAVAAARAAGADVIIVLAHMGIAQFDEGEDAQNQIAEVARVKGVDAVVAGHTHLRFPGPDHGDVTGIDCDTGMIGDVPVVMPGCSASELGVIDLSLSQTGPQTGWRICARASVLRKPDGASATDRTIETLVQDAHDKTRAHLRQPVAALSRPMHSYFALAQPSPIPAMIAAAKRLAIERAVAGTEMAQLPLLAAVATTATGGFDGPENFVSLPAGQLERRHIAGLIPYANQVWAVRASGARLRDWLERSALLFNVLCRDVPDQMLVDPKVPGFRFDAIYGLTYQIDLASPPRFDAAGRAISGAAGRVRDIRWQGAPLDPDQEFLVAVTDHRAGGGGAFRAFNDADTMVRDELALDQALIDYLKDPDCAVEPACDPWHFKSGTGMSAFLHTAPDALNHLGDIARMRPEACGYSADGFIRLRLHL